MDRITRILTVFLVLGALLVGAGCKKQMVTVRTGEIVLCTEGEVISDTTEQLSVPAADVGDYKVTTHVETCELHKKLAALYEAAQAAIAAGDLDSALARLKELTGLDPSYRRAAQQLADIEAGRTPPTDRTAGSGGGVATGGGASSGGASGGGSSSGGSSGTTPPDDDANVPTGPVMNLVNYVPDTLPGFNGQDLIVDVFALTRNYVPTSKGSIATLVIVVEQFQDEAAAKKALDQTIKVDYPQGGAGLTVKGRTGYFGARQGFGVVAFADGALLVAIEGGAHSSTGGTALKAPLTTLADAVLP